MIRALFFAATLALTACGNNSGVMDEIERAEDEATAAPVQEIPGLGAEVQEQAQTLPSGLELQFTRRGVDQTVAQPTMNANVLVHYQGTFVDGGEEFDSSFGGDPVEFPLQAVVPGFSEAISHMRPGDEVIATFPGSLGYGPSGRGPIPPNAALRFRIVLLAYQEPGGQLVQAGQ
jgi:FKBP-type peptidyl-prolyl cis-trans isomerase